MQWAIAHGAKVISISLVGNDIIPLRDAVAAAAQADVVVVAGVGNLPDYTTVMFPAAYDGVVGVGGVDRTGEHDPKSTTGPEVLLSAPVDGHHGPQPRRQVQHRYRHQQRHRDRGRGGRADPLGVPAADGQAGHRAADPDRDRQGRSRA